MATNMTAPSSTALSSRYPSRLLLPSFLLVQTSLPLSSLFLSPSIFEVALAIHFFEAVLFIIIFYQHPLSSILANLYLSIPSSKVIMAPSSLKLAIPLFASLLQASSIDECPMLSKRDDGVINNPPSNDAFYLPPPDFETSLPGDVLSIRQIGEKSSVMESMYQILYRTADTLGRPQAAVTTLWVPQNGTNNQLLSYQTPYDSVNSDCVPSFAVRDASTPVSIGPVDSYDVATINAALANGWYVSMPDYFGPQAAFASGPQAAKATLDGIRAVLQSSDCTGISPDAKVAMYGHSVGAHATEVSPCTEPHPCRSFADLVVSGPPSTSSPMRRS